MRYFCTYIMFFVLIAGFSFSKSFAQKTLLSKKVIVITPIIIDDDNDYKRKRAHKRKRKIRPRRNGF